MFQSEFLLFLFHVRYSADQHHRDAYFARFGDESRGAETIYVIVHYRRAKLMGMQKLQRFLGGSRGMHFMSAAFEINLDHASHVRIIFNY